MEPIILNIIDRAEYMSFLFNLPTYSPFIILKSNGEVSGNFGKNINPKFIPQLPVKIMISKDDYIEYATEFPWILSYGEQVDKRQFISQRTNILETAARLSEYSRIYFSQSC